MPFSLYDGAPLQCSEDGTVFMNLFMDPDSSTEVLFAFGPDGKKTAYPLEEIHDLYGVEDTLSVDATDAGVSFLVRATRDSATEFPAARKTPRYTGQYGWYIAQFDRNGSYKDSFAVDIPHFNPARIAQFDTGQYLVLGIDALETVPKLAMVDSDGTLRRFLNPAKPLPLNSPRLESGLNPSAPKEQRRSLEGAIAVLSYQLTHHGSAIDLLESGSEGPIYEVFADGSMNAIPVRRHPGYELDSLIPSNGKTLFLRFRPDGNEAVKAGQGIIEEIDVTDGTPLKQISFPGLSLWDILCIHDDRSDILRTRQTSSGSTIFDIYKADLVPAPANAAQ